MSEFHTQKRPENLLGTLAERPDPLKVQKEGVLYYATDIGTMFISVIVDGVMTWELASPVSGASTEVFVTLGGDDGNPGTALLPKRTLQNALKTAPIARGSLIINMGPGNFGSNINAESAVTAKAFVPAGSTTIPVNSVPVAMLAGSTILFLGGAVAVLTANAPVSAGVQVLQVGGGVSRNIANGEQGSVFWDHFSSASLLPDVSSGPVGKTIIRGTLAPVGVQPKTSGPSVFTQTSGGHLPAGFVTIPIAGGPFAVNQFRGKLVSAPSSPDSPGTDRMVTSSDANNLFVKIPSFTSRMPDIASGKQLLLQQSASKFTFRFNENADSNAIIDASSSQWVFEHFNPVFGDIIGGNGDDVALENGSFLFSGCVVQGDDLAFRNTKARFLNCDVANFFFFFAFQNPTQYSSFVSLVSCTALFTGQPFSGEIDGTNLSLSIDSCDMISPVVGIGTGGTGGGGSLTITDSDFHGAGSGGGFMIVARGSAVTITRSTLNASGSAALFATQSVLALSQVGGQGVIKIADKVTVDGAFYPAGSTVLNLAAPLAAPVNHNYLAGQTIRFPFGVEPVVLSAPANLGDTVLNVEPTLGPINGGDVGLVQSASSTTATPVGATSITVLPTFADYLLGTYMFWFAAGGTFHVAILSADAPAGSTVLQIFPLQDFFGSGSLPAKAAMDLNGGRAGVGIGDMSNYTESNFFPGDMTLEGDPTSGTNLPTPQAEAVSVGSLGVFSRSDIQTLNAGLGVVDLATLCRAAVGIPI